MRRSRITESQFLIYAIQDRKVKLVKILVEGGTDVNSFDDKYRTTLMFACMKQWRPDTTWEDEEKILRILLKNGADPHAQDVNGNTPLKYACYNRVSDTMIEMLLEYESEASASCKSTIHMVPSISMWQMSPKLDTAVQKISDRRSPQRLFQFMKPSPSVNGDDVFEVSNCDTGHMNHGFQM